MTLTPETPTMPTPAGLPAVCRSLRKKIVRMIGEAGSGHPGGSLSAVEIVTALLFGGALRHRPAEPGWPDRDRFILSKGHACPVLYAAYAELGMIDEAALWTLRKLGSPLQGHPDVRRLPILEASTGSLGQGLSFGLGEALAARLDGRPTRVYVLLGDGECNEGQVWEAAMSAAHHRVDNLVAIVDLNEQQLDGWTRDILGMEPVAEKWRAFGWHVIEVDGHDLAALLSAFEEAKTVRGRPTCVLAHTVKGKGVSFMEFDLEFHGKAPTKDEVARALAELER